MKRASPPGTAAFTLLELLVVVAVIGVIAGLLFPAIRSAQIRAMGAASSGNLRQLVLANLAYASEHGCFVPASDQSNLRRWHGSRSSVRAAFDPATGLLAEYLGRSRRVTPCPLLKQMLDKQGPSFEDGSGGYGYNEVYLGGNTYDTATKLSISIRAVRVARPAQTLMFATTAYANQNTIQEYPFCEPPYWDDGAGPNGTRPSPSLHFRFNGKAIVGWCDGHVTFESMEKRDVGDNPHGGDAGAQQLGWFGPDEQNGYWNPERD